MIKYSKDDYREIASNHYNKMKELYSSQIKDSIINTIKFNENLVLLSRIIDEKRYDNTNIILSDLDSVSAIHKYSELEGKMAVLNFASYNKPGGGFLNGSITQEESLCHSSFLYNVLESFKDSYYFENRSFQNRSLYRNVAMYSPNVYFFRNNSNEDYTKCDVLTCPAPNIRAARKHSNVSEEENDITLYERIKFLLDVAILSKTNTLILGAFGCGAFGQNPFRVAKIFMDILILEGKVDRFKTIVFAIPKGINKRNYDEFYKCINHYNTLTNYLEDQNITIKYK